MFKTKTTRAVVGLLLSVLLTFICFWSITDNIASALKGVLVLYLMGTVFSLTLACVNDWIEKGEGK